MRTILTLKQAPAETLDLLVKCPELAIVFWMNPDYVPPKQPFFARWFARMLGGYTPPMELPEPPPELARNGEELRLEDDWQTIDQQLGLLGAGKPITGSTHGYGDERAVWPEDVNRLADEAVNDEHDRLKNYLKTTAAESLGLVIRLS